MHSTPLSILKKYWGYDGFRPLQAEIINAVISNDDVLALLPTGGGKSICFQVPALCKDGLCIVVSPLIALMKDQVLNLQNRGISALSIHAGMLYPEVKQALTDAASGAYKFLYVSPERLQTRLFMQFLPALQPSLIAIDESHCISQWGYDFRPAYLNIAALRKMLPDVPVIALTASATLKVQQDICDKLQFRNNHKRFQQSFERPNLSYSVFKPTAKETKLIEILQNVKGAGIVYCKSRKQCQQVCDLLKLHGINADFYHAGLSSLERSNRQLDWIANKTSIIVCTNAFGMGIDKPDVRVVVHYEIPDCLENYYQEAGRAGRDGKKSYAVLLYGNEEPQSLLEQAEQRFPDIPTLKKMYINLMNHLQIAGGGGEGESYSFDIHRFADLFHSTTQQVTHALQALAKGNLFSFNESVFMPSTVEFICNRTQLEDIEKLHPALEPLIKTLLRTYEGIFSYPVSIHESQLASLLRKEQGIIKKDLLMLHALSVINYKPTSDKPQIFLLQNRMYADDFTFNFKEHLERKAHYINRLQFMLHYIEEKLQCRSAYIASYFNDNNVKDCGICDNCINKKKGKTTQLPEQLYAFISAKPVSIAIVQKNYGHLPGLKEAINLLLDENKIKIGKDGLVTAGNK